MSYSPLRSASAFLISLEPIYRLPFLCCNKTNNYTIVAFKYALLNISITYHEEYLPYRSIANLTVRCRKWMYSILQGISFYYRLQWAL